jgi:hypothetical protein
MVTTTDKERIRLVEGELAQTNDFIKGVLTTGAAIRGSAITVWLALVGFAVQQDLWELGILAAIVAFVFLLADGYHGWLYSQAFRHARALERLLSRYYATLSRADDDPDAMIIFRRDLRAHRFGLFVSFRERFELKQIFYQARPALFYKVLYPFLVVVALISGVLIGFDVIGKKDNPAPTHVIIECALTGSTGRAKAAKSGSHQACDRPSPAATNEQTFIEIACVRQRLATLAGGEGAQHAAGQRDTHPGRTCSFRRSTRCAVPLACHM